MALYPRITDGVNPLFPHSQSQKVSKAPLKEDDVKVKTKVVDDDTCMTKEEFYAKIERAERDYVEGRYVVINNDKELIEYLNKKFHK